MINIDDFLSNILIQQITIIVTEQGAKRIDFDRIDSAINTANNAVMLIESMNSSELATVTRESLDTLIAKFQLSINLRNSQGIDDE